MKKNKIFLLLFIFIIHFSYAYCEYKWEEIHDIPYGYGNISIKMVNDSSNNLYFWYSGIVYYSKDDGKSWQYFPHWFISDIAAGKNHLIYTQKDSIFQTFDFDSSRKYIGYFENKDCFRLDNLVYNKDTLIVDSFFRTPKDTIHRALYYSYKIS